MGLADTPVTARQGTPDRRDVVWDAGVFDAEAIWEECNVKKVRK